MTTVNIKPMPDCYRKVSKTWWPGKPPGSIFKDCGPDGPTPEEIEEARELFKLLDEQSKDWYGRNGIFEGL